MYKKSVIPLLLILIISGLLSCTDYKSQVENLTREREQLISESSTKDSSINAFIMAINEIDSNVQAMATRQQLVLSESSDKELQTDAKTNILQNMQALELMLSENKEKLNVLVAKLKKSNLRISELEKMIVSLQSQLALKDSELVVLNGRLNEMNIAVANLNATVDTLSHENEEKAKQIAEKINTINTAYYIVGSYKELKEKGIILKDGGFLGMGKTESIVKDFNRKDFTKVDITKFSKLPLNKKKVEFLSIHPTESYKLGSDSKKMFTELSITNAELFWSASKYLVIVAE